jgi:outer membrane protein assembly factor BamA
VVLAVLVFTLALAGAEQQAAVISDVRIQGNVATTDAEVLQLAGITRGMPADAAQPDEVASRLRSTGRFERVDVLKRYASITDPTQIALVIIVDEGRVHVELTGDPDHPTRVVRDRGPHIMFLPIVDAEDGYGVAYGVRFAFPDLVGDRSRLSVPATWGGTKRAALEFDKTLAPGVVDRVFATAAIGQRRNPFFEREDQRGLASLRVERPIVRSLRGGAAGSWQQVSFAGSRDTVWTAGIDATLDTRLDPVLARNAIFSRVAWDHVRVSGRDINRLELEGRGYIGLPFQSILVLHALKSDADQPLPDYLQPLLGGTANLRGFRAGTAVGDTLVAGSVELLVPLTSQFRLGKVGANAFTDAATVYDKPQLLRDQTLRRGVGAGVWLSAAFVRINVAVAHGIGGSTRVHLTGGVTF